MSTPRCTRCQTHQAPRKPSPLWLVAVALAWLQAFVAVVLCSLMGPGLTTILPMLFAGALCLITETHKRAFEWPECRNCGAAVPNVRAKIVRSDAPDARTRSAA